MKTLALLAAIACTALVSAQSAPKTPPTKLKCAVMPDHSATIATATKQKLFADYKGRRYFFCCAGCVPKFKKDPAKYAKTAESIPTPKPPKA